MFKTALFNKSEWLPNESYGILKWLFSEVSQGIQLFPNYGDMISQFVFVFEKQWDHETIMTR